MPSHPRSTEEDDIRAYMVEQENKTLREKDKIREQEIKTLREENKRLKHLPAEKWEVLKDKEGNTYYHNRGTGETSWEPPMIDNPMRQ